MKANRPGQTAAATMLALLLTAGLIPWAVTSCARHDDEAHGHSAKTGESGATYACPMLCVPPTSKPGKCPVCGMALERVDDAGSGDTGSASIALSERSRKLAKIETAAVERKPVAAEVRMTGKVTVDETRVTHITARVAGRIDKVFADFTGQAVEKGSKLVLLYSPELLAAQEELIQAIRHKNPDVIEAARGKLKLFELTEDQIKEIEQTKAASDHTAIFSPAAGAIIMMNAIEGTYVKTGSRMYTIADLSSVWVTLEAYESDVGLLRVGQQAEFSARTHPGKTFKGTVAFIDPVLNEKTRTAGVRLNVPNKDGSLKPGTLVQAMVKSPIGTREKPPLVIPAAAPLITGKRAIVYVGTDTEGKYEGREITLGPRAGRYYTVLRGLTEGDRVVVRGNFRIDSALQIMGRPSMMRPAAQPPAPAGEPQTKCPVMGGAINKDVYVDHGGYRVYFCCPGCDGAFKKDPDKYISKMQGEGVTLAKTPE
ncbi:efflux RND transporter periplasmic adaptor subunit [Verrucomicrobiota bacterium]